MRRNTLSIVATVGIMCFMATESAASSKQDLVQLLSTGWEYETCDDWAEIPVQNNAYRVRNNVFGNNAGEQCIVIKEKNGRFLPAFKVVTTDHAFDPESPASFPSIVKGCHPWGSPCTSGWTPTKVQDIGTLNSKWVVGSTRSAGTMNTSYDLWINPTTDTSGAPTGTEVMVWLSWRGEITPAGQKVGKTYIKEMRAGKWQPVEYDIYYASAHGSTQHYVAYQRTTKANRAEMINLKDALDDCLGRGWCESAWYLVAIEAGFEIWRGGVGLTSQEFSTAMEVWSRPAGRVVGTPNSGYGLEPIYDTILGNCSTEGVTELDEVWNHPQFPHAHFGIAFDKPEKVAGIRFYTFVQDWYCNRILQYKVLALPPKLSPDVESNWVEVVGERQVTGASPGWEEARFPAGKYAQVRVIYTSVAYGNAPKVGELELLTIAR